ncbi:NADH:flavin oxidoreductase [Botrimarina sp.]|uniref:oxidoreductase n=1 Tax=Botrimarina sp. TaxID=2795802 RepID=UPI0032EE7BE5
MNFPKVAKLRTADQLRERLAELGVQLPLDDQLAPAGESPLGEPISVDGLSIGNRFCILPMEGWDGELDGRPTELTRRRWRNFGDSGAKLIWGGEAVAVRHDGRANPNQLVLNDQTAGHIESLREELVAAHLARFGSTDDLLVGLQLTHSGRFARPNDKKRIEPRTAYRHPLLDPRVGVEDDTPVFTDTELDRLVDDFIAAARLAEASGFRFVDVKHCHGYLGHELLSGYDRPGKYGGDFDGRTRFLRNIVEGIRSAAPSLAIGVRVSVFDYFPYHPGPDAGVGVPDGSGDYRYAFGGDGSGAGIDLAEPSRFLSLLSELGVRLVCTTAGSPYYNPHIQRPAAFPPSDGYQPPEDPLVGVARQIDATARLKREHPQAVVVGSAYSYLQDWLPNVAQRVVADGMADAIGLGRMVLSYHDLPADVLDGKAMQRKRICRTFSDCTTAPRNGMVSGCYPLDPFYKERPERQKLAELAAK